MSCNDIPRCGAVMASGLICLNAPKIGYNGRCGVHKHQVKLVFNLQERKLKEDENKLLDIKLQDLENNQLIKKLVDEVREVKMSIKNINNNISSGITVINQINDTVNNTAEAVTNLTNIAKSFTVLAVENERVPVKYIDISEYRDERHKLITYKKKEARDNIVKKLRNNKLLL